MEKVAAGHAVRPVLLFPEVRRLASQPGTSVFSHSCAWLAGSQVAGIHGVTQQASCRAPPRMARCCCPSNRERSWLGCPCSPASSSMKPIGCRLPGTASTRCGTPSSCLPPCTTASPSTWYESVAHRPLSVSHDPTCCKSHGSLKQAGGLGIRQRSGGKALLCLWTLIALSWPAAAHLCAI